jgi:hypothetical protein
MSILEPPPARRSTFHPDALLAWLGLVALVSGAAIEPALSQQQPMNPFAGSLVPGAPGPYGSDVGAYAHLMQSFQTLVTGTPAMLNDVLTGGASASAAAVAPTASDPGGGDMAGSGAGESRSGEKAEAPDSAAGENMLEIAIGACAGGAFLGAYSAATTAAPAVATGVGAVATGTAIISAAAIGCGLGVATAAVSIAAVSGWQSLQR